LFIVADWFCRFVLCTVYCDHVLAGAPSARADSKQRDNGDRPADYLAEIEDLVKDKAKEARVGPNSD